MRDLKEAINHILDEELVKAKELIHTNLYAKMGALLEESLLEYAPTVLDEKKLSRNQKKIAARAGDPTAIDAADFASLRGERVNEKYCEDGDCEDDDEEYSKKKMKKKDDEEDEEDDEEDEKDEKEMNEAFETFTAYISELVEQIEEETGEELSEEEILQLADIVLDENFYNEDEDEQ
jgi:hypothetical protein